MVQRSRPYMPYLDSAASHASSISKIRDVYIRLRGFARWASRLGHCIIGKDDVQNGGQGILGVMRMLRRAIQEQ
jgi:hypothetical protein